MAAFFARTRGSPRPPRPDEVLADIVEFHTANPGVTERTLGELTTDEGLTGYQLLARLAPRGARRVVDLGCGNGPLLSALLASPEPPQTVTGVDLCERDLELARRRLPEGRAELLCEPASRLSLADASADAVLSHHAFYLFDPVEPVIAEIGRVLAPGGLFAFATSSFEPSPGSPFGRMMSAFGALNRRDNPHFQGWGDRRVWSLEGLRGLFFSPGSPFSPDLSVDEHALVASEPPEALCDRLMGFYYSVQLSRPETRDELRRAWLAILSESCRSGVASLRIPFAIVSVRREGGRR